MPSTPTRASLPERLCEARKLAEVGARELDRLAGITEGHTSLIESHRVANVSTQTLAKIATALGVSLDWLVRGVGEEPTRVRVIAAVAEARRVQEVAS